MHVGLGVMKVQFDKRSPRLCAFKYSPTLIQVLSSLCVFCLQPCKYLFDLIFAKGMSVLQSKMELIPELKEKCGLDVPLDRLRLRKKAWKNPGAIYIDSQVYEEDIPIFTNWEVFIEILECKSSVFIHIRLDWGKTNQDHGKSNQ